MSQLELRILVSTTSLFTLNTSLEEYVARVHVQTSQVIEGRLAVLAEETCENQPHRSCHWNPRSEVTGKYCADCPPICRDRSNYLKFSQFTIGAFLLLICGQLVLVPMIGIISDMADENSQVRSQEMPSPLVTKLHEIMRYTFIVDALIKLKAIV